MIDDTTKSNGHIAVLTWILTVGAVGIGWLLHPQSPEVRPILNPTPPTSVVVQPVQPSTAEVRVVPIHIPPPNLRVQIDPPQVSVQASKVEVYPPDVKVIVNVPKSDPALPTEADLERAVDAVEKRLERRVGEEGGFKLPSPKPEGEKKDAGGTKSP